MATAPEVLPVVAPADAVPGPAQGCWTYVDYAAIAADPSRPERYEVVDGVLYAVPSPSALHQICVGWFLHFLTTHVKLPGLGHVFVAPFDAEFGPKDVLQPDVVVVLNARASIITDSRIVGVPDLVIEVVSPGTASYDRREKWDTYARAGVPEYWLADPGTRTVEVLRWHRGDFRSLGVFQNGATLPSSVLPNLPVTVEQFFA